MREPCVFQYSRPAIGLAQSILDRVTAEGVLQGKYHCRGLSGFSGAEGWWWGLFVDLTTGPGRFNLIYLKKSVHYLDTLPIAP